MVRRRNIQSISVSVVTVAVFLVGTFSAEAARKDPGLPGNHLTIEEVQVDFGAGANGQLTILGDSFSFGNNLNVTLGEAAVPLNIAGVPTDTEIVADLPAGLLPGDYLLTVSTGNGQSQNDEYDLTIGAVSGGSCQAGQVVQSIDANGQVTCVEDMHVKGTACPAGQVVTGYDVNGAPQCKVDLDTDTNVFGTSCPEGEVLRGHTADGLPICLQLVADPDPPMSNCPCFGLGGGPGGAVGTPSAAWDDTFPTQTCTTGTNPLDFSHPYGPVGLAASNIDGIDITALMVFPETFTCISGGTTTQTGGAGLSVERTGMSLNELMECQESIIAIANNDGVTCPAP